MQLFKLSDELALCLHPPAYVLRTVNEVTYALTVVNQLDERNSITMGPTTGKNKTLLVSLKELRANAGFLVDGRLELKV